ncbi:MAG: hypothetical protein KAJ40_08385 [Alphaproteobacteria bacterium]|nr:hypothetical protein [Alphaproteobacteria bacterium]
MSYDTKCFFSSKPPTEGISAIVQLICGVPENEKDVSRMQDGANVYIDIAHRMRAVAKEYVKEIPWMLDIIKDMSDEKIINKVQILLERRIIDQRDLMAGLKSGYISKENLVNGLSKMGHGLNNCGVVREINKELYEQILEAMDDDIKDDTRLAKGLTFVAFYINKEMRKVIDDIILDNLRNPERTCGPMFG